MKVKGILLVFGSVVIFLFSPQEFVHAQDPTCHDAAGAPIPCTPTPEDGEEPQKPKRTPTIIFVPPTFTSTPTNTPTYTPTNTATFTPTHTASATPTATETATPTLTPTVTITPSPTPVPVAQSVLPGAGIGVVILFLIVGLLLPAIQKIRVARRGY